MWWEVISIEGGMTRDFMEIECISLVLIMKTCGIEY